jgi:predicted Fe-Mo cluster-binding NifX family protein
VARVLQPLLLMKVGIPTWDGRVSPVLDVARRLLLVEIAGGAEVARREVDLEEVPLASRVKRIRELGVGVLICGAVSWPLEAMLTSAGMRVIPHTCGPVENVLRAFLAGQLASEAFLMPGCRGRRRRFRGGRRHGGRAGASRWGGMV